MDYYEDEYQIADEAWFDPEQTAEALLDAIRENVNSNVNTIAAACALENELSEQAIRFNAILNILQNAFIKCERGEISKQQAVEETEDAVREIKDNCKALYLANVNIPDEELSESEIALLHEVIVGSKDIVTARKKVLEDSPYGSASESYYESLLSLPDYDGDEEYE